jgi:predicted negative regulator of RcsB-dependent stress response
MAAMQRQAASMDPAQMQQAMNMYQGMSPEQRRAMQQTASSMDPETLVQQAGTVQSQLSAQQKYQYDGSNQLKLEGNRLHGLKQYKEAAEKYKKATENLTTHTAPQSITLKTSCHSNLASCYLQLGKWNECVTECNAVLATDASNRKAFYRRGQAFVALGRNDEAVVDLQKALELSPDSEKEVIREKLVEAEEKQKHAARGVVIEEIVDQEESQEDKKKENGGGYGGAASNEEGEEDGNITDSSIPGLEPSAPPAPDTFKTTNTTSTTTTTTAPPKEQVAMAAEMMKKDPDMLRKAAEMMSSMSDAELAANMAMAGGGMPGATPEMARAAAAMMKNMSTEEIKIMAEKAVTGGGGLNPILSGAGAMPGGSMPQDPVAAAAAASEYMKQDPSMLKNAAKMMQNMAPEQLEAMAAAMPGGGAGMKFDPEQMKMAAKMMESMSPDDFERMTQMAQSMGVAPPMPSIATGSVPAAGTAGTATATATAATIASVPGAAPRFDPGAISPETMSNMRKQLNDPQMLRSMQSMLKGMDPQSLASMMKASGMDMSPEQAQKMVDSLGNVSDKQLEWIARLSGAVNAIIDTYQRMKAWAISNGAMTLALILLLIFLFCRWVGWL